MGGKWEIRASGEKVRKEEEHKNIVVLYFLFRNLLASNGESSKAFQSELPQTEIPADLDWFGF